MDLNDPNLCKQGTIKFRLTDEQRQLIVEALLAGLNSKGRPQQGRIKKVAERFNCSRRTISCIWKTTRAQTEDGVVINVKSKMAGRVGRKRHVHDLSQMQNIPLRKRTNIRSLASSLGIPKTTTHNLVKNGLIRPHSNAIKPSLTDANKQRRVEWCLSQLQPNNTIDNPIFNDMKNVIHIDEKWFYMTQAKQRYYLHEEEPEPYRCCKSKGFIGKIMFPCGVARPEIGGDYDFDGKIGIFPFVTIEPAQRKSKNRPAGTMVMKPIASITKEVIRNFMIHQLLPAIKDKWPPQRGKTVFIQQDNARPHISPNDEEFLREANKDGWNIRLVCQPANNPDLNVLDLGWFRAIQTIQHEMSPRSVDELVDIVKLAYEKLQTTSLNYIWLTLQTVMAAILKAKGTNVYKVPHMGKERLAREGNLPTVIEVDAFTVQEAISFLNQHSENMELVGGPSGGEEEAESLES